MIETRERLIHVLTEAAEVEHNVLCSYLYAAFSLKRANEVAKPEQGKAVERWRKQILSVAIEEMAHLAGVNNLLLAIGGAAHLDRPNLPVPPGYHPADIVVRLTPFDRATLDHFIFLERPEEVALPDAGGFEPNGPPRELRPGALTPSSVDYATLGELYDRIAEGFKGLAARLGEGTLIDPDGRGQLRRAAAGMPDIDAITSLDQALATIERIKEQGEGSSGKQEDSHFDRFLAIREEWQALLTDDPDFAPAWPAAADPVMRRPAEDAVRVWITAPAAAAELDFGNAAYGLMLIVLSQIFGQEDEAEQGRLMQLAMRLMAVAGGVGNRLARLPAIDGDSAVNAGLSFAVPRNLGIRPARWEIYIGERLAELRTRAAALFEGEAKVEMLRRLGEPSR